MKKTGYYIFLIISVLMLFFVVIFILCALGLKVFGWPLALICGSIIIFLKPGLYQAYFNKKPENGNPERPAAFLLLVAGVMWMLVNYIAWYAKELATQNLINRFY